MKAIQVKIIPMTNYRPTRIKAWTEGSNQITFSKTIVEGKLHHEKHPNPTEEQIMKRVAVALCLKMHWPTDLVGGGLPNGDWAFCFMEAHNG